MSSATKRDNTTQRRKVALRLALLRELAARAVEPVVLETHGGWGVLGRHSYPDVQRGVVFDRESERAEALAHQRPTWAVYEADCVAALEAGIGAHLAVNLVDVDPYGDPWPALAAFFRSARPRPDVMVVAVNDGMRLKLRTQSGWVVRSLADAVDKYGNAALYENYLAICEEKLSGLAAEAGYRLDRWTGYYCGTGRHMTHYGAIFTGASRGAPAPAGGN